MYVYIPILTTCFNDNFNSQCPGAFSTEKKARDVLIGYLVEFGHIPYQLYLDSLGNVEYLEGENIVSAIFKANLQTEEAFILYLCEHCNNMEDLQKYIYSFGDSYYNQMWKIQIVKSYVFA